MASKDSRLFYSGSVDPESRRLSNFAECHTPLEIDGRRYATVEHFYQASKFLFLGLTQTQRLPLVSQAEMPRRLVAPHVADH